MVDSIATTATLMRRCVHVCVAASVIFVGQVISAERKVLALYPVLFFYLFLSWMVLIQ